MRKIKTFCYGCLALAALAFLIGAAAPEDQGAALAGPGTPKAEFGHVKYSWTTAIEGEKVKHTFPVRNRGAAELIIEQVKTA
ncbi:MAG: hypothetical protein HZB23_04250 [Deltaproteobacteria bacterium]|nr:hypothetical protein [Deltaproteobacteria bacterium]